MNNDLLRVEGVSLRRNGRDILSNVNLVVQAGQIHGLLGLNGSGKSSLAYTLMGCAGYAPGTGRILLAGQDITNLSVTDRARLGLTLAWQEPARFEGLRVGDYLSAGTRMTREQLWEALDTVALPPLAYLRRQIDSTLSGGERKRIELAAVFAMHPKVAILDEPDSGVDTLSLGDITALLRRMAGEGTAILLITHRDEMIAAADTASLMCMGSIVFQGAPSAVREYYGQRCRLHGDALGAQPWIVPQNRAPTQGS